MRLSTFQVILCGGTSKIPRLQKHIASLFPDREVLASLSPDEVLALGAASQASLLNEAWLDENTTGDESEYVRTKLIATKQSVVYNINSSDDATERSLEARTVTLIPFGVPIPTRRSNHLTDNDISILPGKEPRIKITLFTKSKDDTLNQITTVSCTVNDAKILLKIKFCSPNIHSIKLKYNQVLFIFSVDLKKCE